MNIEIVSQDKKSADIKIDNLTIAEVLRVYLNEQGADFAVWRREHPSKPLVMKIKTSEGTVGKAVEAAASAIKKDCDKLVALVKK
jgi:DNA-directed RNA polymerase subunit L